MAIECVTKHAAFIMERGGVNRLWPLVDLAQIRWERRRDDISEANLKIASRNCFAQENILSQIEPGRHELVLFRNGARVWEGPVTRIGMSADAFEIHAKDVMHYLSRMLMKSAYSNGGTLAGPAIDRIKKIIDTEYVRVENAEQAAYPDLPARNVRQHIVYHQTPTDARTSRITPRFYRTVWEEIDDIASKGGIDYTVIGRAIHFWDTSKPLGTTPTATQAEFNEQIAATIYGMDLATYAAVTDGQGAYGEAGGIDPYYGLVENLETAYDESEGADPPTESEMASQAQRNLVGRNPTPLVLRVPDNSTLNPTGVLTLEHLVPGAFVPLRAKILVRTFNQMQKLDRVSVVENPAKEEVKVVMSPATTPDEIEE